MDKAQHILPGTVVMEVWGKVVEEVRLIILLGTAAVAEEEALDTMVAVVEAAVVRAAQPVAVLAVAVDHHSLRVRSFIPTMPLASIAPMDT